MNAGSNIESSDLKKSPLPGVEECDTPPYDVVDAEAAVPQHTPSPESRLSRVKTAFLIIQYTVTFVIAALLFCLRGSVSIGFPYDERSACYTRATYASILGSVILGPVYFTSERFMTFMKARHEIVNIRIANGRLLKALGHSIPLYAVMIGIVASAASLGYGLIFWPLVYSNNLPTEKMALDAVLVPVACLLGGLRWAYEMVTLTMWVLIRIPKISTGLEGNKYDRLLKITCVLVFGFLLSSLSNAHRF